MLILRQDDRALLYARNTLGALDPSTESIVDIDRDPDESRNLLAEMKPEIVTEFRRRAESLLDTTNELRDWWR